jgi:hypothetical protein
MAAPAGVELLPADCTACRERADALSTPRADVWAFSEHATTVGRIDKNDIRE